MARRLEYVVPPEYDGKRAVAFLRGHCGFSARLVKKVKYTDGGMLLNGAYLRTVDPVKCGDIVSVLITDDEATPEPMHAPLDIVYRFGDAGECLAADGCHGTTLLLTHLLCRLQVAI